MKKNIFEPQSEQDQIEEALKKQRILDKFGYYDQPISFRPYDILDKKTGTLIGRLDYKSSEPGFVESSLYLLKEYRGHGYGPEVLVASKKYIIDPALGMSYNIDNTFYYDEYTTRSNIQYNTISRFKGAIAKCDTFYNYGSFSTHIKSGFSGSWVDFMVHTIYPRQEDHYYMTSEEANSLRKIMKVFINVVQDIKKLDPNSVTSIYPSWIFQHIRVLKKDQEDQLINNVASLMKTKDINTFMSALSALVLMDQADPEWLGKFVEVPSLNTKNLSIKQQTICLIKKHKDLLEKLGVFR